MGAGPNAEAGLEGRSLGRGRETLTSPILGGSGGVEVREDFPAGRVWCPTLALSDRCYPSLAVCLGLLAPMGRTYVHRVRVVVAETLQVVRLKVWRVLPALSSSSPLVVELSGPARPGNPKGSQARGPPCPSFASWCGSHASPSFALKLEITSFLLTPNCRKMKCRRV